MGLCSNLPSQCSKAASREAIAMPTPETTCPECGSRLQPLGGRTRAAGVERGPLIAGGVALLAILGAIWLGWSLLHGGRPNVAQNAATTAAGAPVGGSYLRLSGSNTIGSQLAPALVAAWLKSKGAVDIGAHQRVGADGKPTDETDVSATLDGQPIRVEVKAHGSATAFTDLAAGAADIGMASRAVKGDEAASLSKLGDMRGQASEHVLGLDGVAVIVPQSNAVPKLSRADLARIFSGSAANWSAFGGPNLQVHLYARDDKSGTYDTFKSLVLRDQALGPAKRFEDSAALEAAVAGDPGGVGFVGLPYVKSTRAVPIYDGTSAPLEPTRFSVKTENYPLSRRLFLYTPAAASGPAADFTRFALSAAGQAVVRDQHFVDLDLTQAAASPTPPITSGDCRLSSRWTGDPNAYCDFKHGAEQLPTSFRFLTGSSQLDTRAVADLRRVLERMEQSPGKSIVLAGFADSSGAYPANCALSRARAAAVGAAFATLGIKPSQTLGFCNELPVRDNSTLDGREQNRRVEIFLK